MANASNGVALLFTAGLLIFWLTPISAWWMLSSHPDRSARLWFVGTALYALVATSFVFSPLFPPWIRGPLASALSLASIFCMTESIRRELRETPPPLLIYSISLVAYFCLMLALMVEGVFLPYGLAINLFVLSVIEFILIILTFKVQRSHQSRSLWLIIAVLLLFMASNLSRILVFIMSGSIPMLLDFSPLANAAILINILSVIFYCYGYWGFVIEKNRRALILANERAIEAREKEAVAFASKRFAEDALKERTELMARLTEATKLAQSGALSAAIAHEINQPLAAIYINTAEAKRILEGYTAQNDIASTMTNMIGRIQSDNIRISAIIKRIRSIFRDEPLNIQVGDIDHLIKKVALLLRSRCLEQKVSMNLHLDARQTFRFSTGEIEHVIINVLTNAIDAVQCQSDAKVEVQTWIDGDTVVITVDDNGAGVPDNKRELIFELRETSKASGSGLGLWLSRYIVERHNGSIEAARSALGGARFTIRLPLGA